MPSRSMQPTLYMSNSCSIYVVFFLCLILMSPHKSIAKISYMNFHVSSHHFMKINFHPLNFSAAERFFRLFLQSWDFFLRHKIHKTKRNWQMSKKWLLSFWFRILESLRKYNLRKTRSILIKINFKTIFNAIYLHSIVCALKLKRESKIVRIRYKKVKFRGDGGLWACMLLKRILLTLQLPYLLALSPIHIISLDLEQNCNSFFFISFYASVNVTQNAQTDLSLSLSTLARRPIASISLTLSYY